MSFYFTLNPPAGHTAIAGGRWFIDARDGWTVDQLAQDAADTYNVGPCDIERGGVPLDGEADALSTVTEGETLSLVVR